MSGLSEGSLEGRGSVVEFLVGRGSVVEVEGEGDGVGSSLVLLSVGVSGVSIVVEIGGLLSVDSSSSEANKNTSYIHINNFENGLTFTNIRISVITISFITLTVSLTIEPCPIIQTYQVVVVTYIREM